MSVLGWYEYQKAGRYQEYAKALAEDAERGDTLAQIFMCINYRMGHQGAGIQRDIDKAISWAKRALDLGDDLAPRLLAECLAVKALQQNSLT